MSTVFNIWDSEPTFVSDMTKTREYVRRKLGLDKSGHSGVNVELSDNLIDTSFEESTADYSSIVNSYHAKSNLNALLGMLTGTLSGSENRYPFENFEKAKRTAAQYGSEIGVGGNCPIYSGSIIVKNGLQDYDLNTFIPTGSFNQSVGDRLEVINVWHYQPYTAYRFYNQSSYVNYTLNEFGIRYFTPETAYYLLPTWEDTLRTSQYKYSHKLRRSNYSYTIKNNRIRIFPIPSSDNRVWFEYRIIKGGDPFHSEDNDPSVDGVSNLSNIPYGFIQYNKLNSLSKQWIRKMCLSLCKEILGNIRGKFSSIPIPNGEVTLNHSDLLTQSREEQTSLREELKTLLDATTYDQLAAKQLDKANAEFELLKRVPLFIEIG